MKKHFFFVKLSFLLISRVFWPGLFTHTCPTRHYTVPNLDSPNVFFSILFWSKPIVREFVRFFFKIILIVVIVNTCASHNKCSGDSPLLKNVLFKNTNIIIIVLLQKGQSKKGNPSPLSVWKIQKKIFFWKILAFKKN